MKIDFQNKPYRCERYGQIVTVRIERHHCEKEPPACIKPQPHITHRKFRDCSDLLNCGLGKAVGGKIITPFGLHECPANRSLENGEDL